MAILKKEDFLARIKQVVGEDTSEDSIQLIEDFADTYADLETKTSGYSELENKYKENDTMWRKKYTDRFFTGSDNPDEPDEPDAPDEQDVTINDLFKESEVK